MSGSLSYSDSKGESMVSLELAKKALSSYTRREDVALQTQRQKLINISRMLEEKVISLTNGRYALQQYSDLIQIRDLGDYLGVSYPGFIESGISPNFTEKLLTEIFSKISALFPIDEFYAEEMYMNNDISEIDIPISNVNFVDVYTETLEDDIVEGNVELSALEFLVVWLLFFETDKLWAIGKKRYTEWKGIRKPKVCKEGFKLNYEIFYKKLAEAGIQSVVTIFDMACSDTGNTFIDDSLYDQYTAMSCLYPLTIESVERLKNEWERCQNELFANQEKANKIVTESPETLLKIIKLLDQSTERKVENVP